MAGRNRFLTLRLFGLSVLALMLGLIAAPAAAQTGGSSGVHSRNDYR